MKQILAVFALALVFFQVGPDKVTTYTAQEDKRSNELHNLYFIALRVNDPAYTDLVLDSMRQFMHAYPSSVMKSAIWRYETDLNATLGRTKLSNRTADSLLACDSMPQTKLWLGQLMIERRTNPERGEKLVQEASTGLNTISQMYLAARLLARRSLEKGKYADAELKLRRAIALDSSRDEAWFDLLRIARKTENRSLAGEVEAKINSMNEKDLAGYGVEASASTMIGKNLSHLSFKDVNGKTVHMESFKNKNVVLDFFHFWCTPCEKEFPQLRHLSQEFPQVEFLYVNTFNDDDESRKKVLANPDFAFLWKSNYLLASDSSFTGLDISSVPTTLIIDSTGVVRDKFVGYVSGGEAKLKKSLEELVKEK